MTRQEMREFAASQVTWYEKENKWIMDRIERINNRLKQTRKEDKEQQEFARTYEGGKYAHLYEGNYQGDETRKLINERRRHQRELKKNALRIEHYKREVEKYTNPADKPQEAPAAEAEQQPTETENAPQAATQAAEGTARQTEDITAAIIDSMTATAPAQTITATLIGPDGTPYRATYSANLLDSLRTEARVLDIQDDETGELIYIKPDDAPAAQAEADPTETTERTTDEQKEEDKTMSSTERYDYLEHMTTDVIDAISTQYTDAEIRRRLDDDRDDFAQELHDTLWGDDDVTGNSSGSYYYSTWRAEEAIAHNWDLIADVIDEWECPDILRKGPEAIDVSIRCYLLGQAIDAALDQLDDEIPEAEEAEDTEDTEDAADTILA